jgi:hypothetical protein
MAFPDTFTVTVNAVAKVLTKINSGNPLETLYRLRGTLDQYDLRISHKTFTDKTRGTVNRHGMELIHTVYPVSPSVIPTIRKTYTVFEETPTDVVADVQKFDEAFVAALTAGNITKLLNYE